MEKLKGTKEWADHGLNLYTGNCATGCIYCYANANNNRFKKSGAFKIKASMLAKNFKKKDGVTMYPTSHDIRPENLAMHVEFLHRFLKAGNKILIVTKPFHECIERLCKELFLYREQVEFRFTVGSTVTAILHFYEPNSSSFLQRAEAIEYAYQMGYKTSLSIEPMLDIHPEHIVHSLDQFITGEIWIGKMNHAVARVGSNKHKEKIKEVRELISWQASDANIMGIVNRLSSNPKVRWKDSIQDVIKRNRR